MAEVAESLLATGNPQMIDPTDIPVLHAETKVFLSILSSQLCFPSQALVT
jgi:hypothetical protein